MASGAVWEKSNIADALELMVLKGDFAVNYVYESLEGRLNDNAYRQLLLQMFCCSVHC